VPEFSVLWTPFVFGAKPSLADFVLILYALGTAAYVAYPMLRQWIITVRQDAALAWTAYGRRARWGL